MPSKWTFYNNFIFAWSLQSCDLWTVNEFLVLKTFYWWVFSKVLFDLNILPQSSACLLAMYFATPDLSEQNIFHKLCKNMNHQSSPRCSLEVFACIHLHSPQMLDAFKVPIKPFNFHRFCFIVWWKIIPLRNIFEVLWDFSVSNKLNLLTWVNKISI